MCGIYCTLGNRDHSKFLKKNKRGPDNTRCVKIDDIYMSFHRLQING